MSLLGLGDPGTPAPAPLVDALQAAVLSPDADRDLPLAADVARVGRDGLVAALLAVEPLALRRWGEVGLPERTVRGTLADVGRKIDAYGVTADLPWLVGLLRADVVAVGRLQVQRVPDPDGRALHVPEGGPLRPADVTAALAAIGPLLGPAPLHCTTWLFDPALLALPPESNIRAFARRFVVEAAPPSEDGVRDACRFVFRRPVDEVLDPAGVVPRTRLEHIVCERLRGGHGWSTPRGVLSNPGTPTEPGALALG